MKTYQQKKEEAKQKAIEIYQWLEYEASYEALCIYQQQLYKLAKRYGLIKEFRENGII